MHRKADLLGGTTTIVCAPVLVFHRAMGSSPVMGLLLEQLEARLDPLSASAVLFEAIQLAGAEPRSETETYAFLRGPFRVCLGKRLGLAVSQEIEERAAEIVSERFRGAAPKGRGRKPWWGLRTAGGASGGLRVLVVAESKATVNALCVIFGSDDIIAASAPTLEHIKTAIDGLRPTLVLLDAGDYPHGDVEALAELLQLRAPTALCLVWGSDLPQGARFAKAIERHRMHVISVRRVDGIEPLLDVFRAQQQT